MFIKPLLFIGTLLSSLPLYAAGYGDIQFKNMTPETTVNIDIYGQNNRILGPGEMFSVHPYPLAGGFIRTAAGAPSITSITVSDSDRCVTTYTSLCFQLFSNDNHWVRPISAFYRNQTHTQESATWKPIFCLHFFWSPLPSKPLQPRRRRSKALQ